MRLSDSLIAARKSKYDASTVASRERTRSASQQRERINSKSSHVVAELASDMAHSPQQIRRRSLASSKIVQHTQPINDHLVVTHASGRTAPPRAASSSRRPRAAALVAQRHTSSRASSRASSRRSDVESKASVQEPLAAPPAIDAKASSQRLFKRSQQDAKRAAEAHEAQIAALMHTMRHLPHAFRQAMLSSHTPGTSSHAVVASAIARVQAEHEYLQLLARRRVHLGSLQPTAPTSAPVVSSAVGRPVVGGAAAAPPPETPTPPAPTAATARERHRARRPSTSSAISRTSVASDGPTPRHADSLHTHVHRMAEAAVAKASTEAPVWVTGRNWTPGVTAPEPFRLSTTNKRRPVVRPPPARRTSSAAMERLFRGKSSVPPAAGTAAQGAKATFPSPAAARDQARRRAALMSTRLPSGGGSGGGQPSGHHRRQGSNASASTADLSHPAPAAHHILERSNPSDAARGGVGVPSVDAASILDPPEPPCAGLAAESMESSLSSIPSLHSADDSASGAFHAAAFLGTQPSALAAASGQCAALPPPQQRQGGGPSPGAEENSAQQRADMPSPSSSGQRIVSVPSVREAPGQPAGGQSVGGQLAGWQSAGASESAAASSVLDDILASAIFSQE